MLSGTLSDASLPIDSIDSNYSSEIESATPLGAMASSPHQQQPPPPPQQALVEPPLPPPSAASSSIVSLSAFESEESEEVAPIVPNETRRISFVLTPPPPARKRVTFGPVTIILIPPRSGISDSQDTIDSPPPSLEDDDGEDLLPLLASGERPPPIHEAQLVGSGDEDYFLDEGPREGNGEEVSTSTSLMAVRASIKGSFSPDGISSVSTTTTLLQRGSGGETRKKSSVDVGESNPWVDSTPPYSLPSPPPTRSTSTSPRQMMVAEEEEEMEFTKSGSNEKEEVVSIDILSDAEVEPQQHQEHHKMQTHEATTSSVSAEESQKRQQTSLSQFGFSATTSKTPSVTGQKRNREKSELKKKKKGAGGSSKGGAGATTHQGEALHAGGDGEEECSSEYELDEPISYPDMTYHALATDINNGNITTHNQHPQSTTGPPTTSFSQFEIIGMKPSRKAAAGGTSPPEKGGSGSGDGGHKWTDEASQESIPPPAAVDNSSSAKKAPSAASENFWSRIRSITNVGMTQQNQSTHDQSPAVPLPVPTTTSSPAVVSPTTTVQSHPPAAAVGRDTSPVLFSDFKPVPPTPSSEASGKASNKNHNTKESAYIVGSQSRCLSDLAKQVETPTTTPTKQASSNPPPSTRVEGSAATGHALVCDLCGLAELKGSEGMILASIADTATPSSSSSSTNNNPPSYNAKYIPGFYVVHLLCALWSPEVYYEEEEATTTGDNSNVPTGHYCGIAASVRRARHIKCVHCREPGASIGCIKATCQRSYHRQCAEDAGAVLDCEEYQLACPHHKHFLPSSTTK